MIKTNLLIILSAVFLVAFSCKNSSDDFRTISPEVLKDKIAGGWAGKIMPLN